MYDGSRLRRDTREFRRYFLLLAMMCGTVRISDLFGDHADRIRALQAQRPRKVIGLVVELCVLLSPESGASCAPGSHVRPPNRSTLPK